MEEIINQIKKTGLHKKWWGILILLGLSPFILIFFITYVTWKQPEWSIGKKILITMILWFIVIVGLYVKAADIKRTKPPSTVSQKANNNPPVQQVKNENQAVSETPEQQKVTKSIEKTSPQPPKPYDQKLGNNRIAADYAQELMDAADSSAPGYIMAVFVEVSPDVNNTDEVNSVFVQVKIDSSLWTTTNDGLKKDFVSAYLISAKKEFPKAFPHIYIRNEFREVAKGELSMFGEPKIELK